MKTRELILRCYAERKNEQWQAFCLDLCRASQADTFEEAFPKLEAMVEDYLEEALTGEDKAYAEQLLSRKAPLSSWIRYVRLRFYEIIAGVHKDFYRLFTVPLPLTPAHPRTSV